MILEHRKSTATEGMGLLGTMTATVIGFGVFQYFLFPEIWADSPWFVVAFVGIEVVVCTIAIIYVVLNIRARQTFVCELDEDEIRCFTPVKWCGESFTAKISEIQEVEKEEWGDDGWRWYIWDKSGRRLWLTSNYDNPADQFIELIRELNCRVVETGTYT